MLITRTSVFTGKEHQFDLPITEDQLAAWKAGTLVQDAFPHLTLDQREFLISGATPQEWKDVFDKEEDDYEDYPEPKDAEPDDEDL